MIIPTLKVVVKRKHGKRESTISPLRKCCVLLIAKICFILTGLAVSHT